MTKIVGRNNVKLIIRGNATAKGRLAFYFKLKGSTILLQNKYWFTSIIPEGATLDVIEYMLNHPQQNVMTYKTMPLAYEDAPTDASAFISNWPMAQQSDGSYVSLMATEPLIYKTSDYLGEKLVMEFTMNPARFEYYKDKKLTPDFGDVTVQIEQIDGLTGFGCLNICSDYSTYVRFNKSVQKYLQNQFKQVGNVYMSLRFMVNTWLTGDSVLNAKEDIGKAPKYFYVPVYAGDTLAAIGNRINCGDNSPGHIACMPLRDQLNEHFNRIWVKLGSTDYDVFNVTAASTDGTRKFNSAELTLNKSVNDLLEVRIWASSEQIQHEVSCCAYQTTELYVTTICNQYYIGENMFELRSYYDMYGVDKPYGTNISQEYKPLAYGFKFNLDYITEYQETEASSLDVTPIPGSSSAKAIGIDASGATRDITITGTRIDNSNYWMFHVPWQEQGMNQGIIYTGTSNWGWIKFMKAVLGCFQMTSGPYRLIMLTIPSSAQQQYFPTRDGVFQYSDGTYVLYVGWEDMCYVMVENFTHSRTEDAFNAINYTLKLKRVVPLLANL